jgi:predicted CxxxxCH...CXXCH cytochrome family protein
VVFGTFATFGGSPAIWDRPSATCSSTYCHGAQVLGGDHKNPVWTTADGSQMTCGSCHGAPPPGPHPTVSSSLSGCAVCHPDTVTATGTIVQGGKHIDGVKDVASGHNAAWMDQASPGFHAYTANRGLGTCQACHQDLAGANGFCTGCHRSGGTGLPWNCTMCHGGTQNPTGAPPKATWGNNTPSTPTNVRIGAHTRHVSGNTISRPFACSVCHVTPADVLAAGHIDEATPTAEVTFSGLATSGGTTPSWTRISASSGTCASTYCHGSPIPGGTAKTPNWTGGASQAACNSCHGAPPDDGPLVAGSSAHRRHNLIRGIPCSRCHNGYDAISAVKTADKDRHLNGTRDVRVNTCTLPCSVIDEFTGLPVPAVCDPTVDPACTCEAPVPAYCDPAVQAECVCQMVTLTGSAPDGTGWNCGGCHSLFPPRQ